MSDVRCVVCGEPWDYYGVSHGDMEKWEARLFKAGAGCPACEGVLPPEPFEPRSIGDLENGDEDEMERLVAYANRPARPEWKRPEPEVLWTCDGCGVQVVRNPDTDELEYDLPPGARGCRWYASHSYRLPPGPEPAHVFGKSPVCEYCFQRCARCGAPVSSVLEHGDVYDPGWCSTVEGRSPRDVFCITCIESQCPECGQWPEDCECKHE